jgi:hypothetical protein
MRFIKTNRKKEAEKERGKEESNQTEVYKTLAIYLLQSEKCRLQ